MVAIDLQGLSKDPGDEGGNRKKPHGLLVAPPDIVQPRRLQVLPVRMVETLPPGNFLEFLEIL